MNVYVSVPPVKSTLYILVLLLLSQPATLRYANGHAPSLTIISLLPPLFMKLPIATPDPPDLKCPWIPSGSTYVVNPSTVLFSAIVEFGP